MNWWTENKSFFKDYEMRITLRGIASMSSLVITIAGFLIYCGVLKERIYHNQVEIVQLEGKLVATEQELKIEIEKKVDISLFNTAHEALKNSLGQMRQDNTEDHNVLKKDLNKIDSKIDRLIERQ